MRNLITVHRMDNVQILGSAQTVIAIISIKKSKQISQYNKNQSLKDSSKVNS
jgi:hypothetical protein